MALHVLVHKARGGFTAAQIAKACQRDPTDPSDLDEVEAALEVLLNDNLAHYKDDLYRPTRAAVRADELSF